MPPDIQPLLYGRDDTERIVAVELRGGDRVAVYRRGADDRVEWTLEPFSPWLLTTEAGVEQAGRRAGVRRLEGHLPLAYRLDFKSWRDTLDARDQLRDRGLPHHQLASPVDQYLAATGRTLFKGMAFDDLVRLQIDIETTTLEASDAGATILAIALSTNRGHAEVLDGSARSEAALLAALTARIQELDPDVIEGHNLFNFDIPFLLERAQRNDVPLNWGRDGSPPRVHGTQRFKAGQKVIPYQGVSISGRHIIDTYQQIQRYDYAGEMQSYGLKQAVEALGLTRADRVFVPGEAIAATWASDRARILAYALDDVRDVALLSSLAAPTEFYQTQILPRSFQAVATGGPGEKINTLMTRVYLALGHSLPLPQEPRPYPGGYTELRRSGVFRPTVKCDVESLYPAIMLTDRIGPESDVLGVYLGLLKHLTQRRIEAKRRARETQGEEQARWSGLQSSFKVLINSFSGYLGYNRALFNDYRAAERVTLRGQALIQRVVAELERLGAEPIEIDTDGVYFRPPEGVSGVEAEERFVGRLGECLPRGINLAYDGSYRGMVSLRTKNYALVGHDGRAILKGSSLRSRRDERIFRRFLADAARAFVESSTTEVRTLYLDLAARIQRRELPPEEITRWETVTEKTFTSESNRRVAGVAADERVGERIAVYQRTGGELARIDDYDGDADVDYLLRRLHDMAGRFAPLLPDTAAFEHTFPRLTAQSDIEAARAAPRTRQLSLFD